MVQVHCSRQRAIRFGLGMSLPLFVLFLGLTSAPVAAVEVHTGGEVRFNIGSFMPWTVYDAREDASEFLLHLTRAHVGADLSGRVKGFIEVQSFGDFGRNDADLGIWWPDRRDDHKADEDIWLYQGYVAAEKILRSPFSITLGKQELVYGNEFLLGNNDTGDMFFGHSFDAIKGRGAWEKLTVDAFMARLNDNRFLLDIGEQVSSAHYKIRDRNASLYGAYGVWTGAAHAMGLGSLDGYLLSVETGDFNEALAGQLAGFAPGVPLPAAFPGQVNMDGRHGWMGGWGGWFPAGRWDRNPTGWWQRRNTTALGAGALALSGGDTLTADSSLNTAGFRVEGLLPGNVLDYDLEYAHQFGRTGRPDFQDSTRSTGHFAGWAIDLELGHEFSKAAGRPRLSAGYVQLSGGPGANARDASGALQPDNDVETFQRLWSDRQYGENLDRAPFGVFLSNVKILEAGFDVGVGEQGSISLDFFRYRVDDRLDPNGPLFGANPEAGDASGAADPTVGERARRPSDNLGSEIDILGTYLLTDDLRSTAGYALFLNGDTLRDQTPSEFDSGTNQHYVFLDVKLTF